MKKIVKNKKGDKTKIIFAIIIILLFLGVIITIALGNLDKLSILWKTP